MTTDPTTAALTDAAKHVTFGIEIECTIPRAARVSIGGYHSRQITVEGGTDAAGAYLAAPAAQGKWHAESDASIAQGRVPAAHVTVEFVSPILSGEVGLDNAVKFMEWITAIGGRVNTACGLHIHIGAKSVVGAAANTEQIVEWARKMVHVANINQRAIYAQTGTVARENGNYCRPIAAAQKSLMRGAVQAAQKGHTFDAQAGVQGVGRYHSLNTATLFSKGTVEFRAFAGTLNTDKLLHALWTALFLAVFAHLLKRPTFTGAAKTQASGVSSLKNLHRKAAGAAQFGLIKERWTTARTTALDMAAKYDAARGVTAAA